MFWFEDQYKSFFFFCCVISACVWVCLCHWGSDWFLIGQ